MPQYNIHHGFVRWRGQLANPDNGGMRTTRQYGRTLLRVAGGPRQFALELQPECRIGSLVHAALKVLLGFFAATTAARSVTATSLLPRCSSWPTQHMCSFPADPPAQILSKGFIALLLAFITCPARDDSKALHCGSAPPLPGPVAGSGWNLKHFSSKDPWPPAVASFFSSTRLFSRRIPHTSLKGGRIMAMMIVSCIV